MNTDTLKGDWKQVKGQVKEAFGKLTDDDLLVAEGNAEQLVGAIQKRYGYTREKADEAWDAFRKQADIAAHAGDQPEDAVDEQHDVASPNDVNSPAHTLHEAWVREQVVMDAHNARREF